MGRIVASAAAALALAALFYGVVLNGFGLFGPVREPDGVPVAAPAPPPPAVMPRPEPDAAAPAPQPATGSGPAAPEGEAPGPSPAPDPVRAARDVTPPNVLSRPTTPYREPVVEAGPPQDEPAAARRYHRVVVRDAGTLQAGDVTIRFAGVSPVAGDRTCTDEAGRAWPCGRVAAAALRQLIRHRAIDCAVVSESAEGILGTCSVGLRDINGWLVEQGWAEAGAGYAEEAEAARGGKRGIYLAEWQEKGPGGTDAVPQAAFTAPAIPPDAYSNLPLQGAPQRVPQGPVEGAVDQGTGLLDAVEGNE